MILTRVTSFSANVFPFKENIFLKYPFFAKDRKIPSRKGTPKTTKPTSSYTKVDGIVSLKSPFYISLRLKKKRIRTLIKRPSASSALRIRVKSPMQKHMWETNTSQPRVSVWRPKCLLISLNTSEKSRRTIFTLSASANIFSSLGFFPLNVSQT